MKRRSRLRIAPLGGFGRPPGPLPRGAEHLCLSPDGWIVILSGFFEPLFYLASIGFGLGALIGTVNGPGGQPISYQLFVAPGLLASAAMNGAIAEARFNFFFKLRYNKTFDAILSTPLSAGDIAVGELVWALIRGGIYAIGFLIVMAILSLIVSPVGDPRRSRRRC
jgi:lipooligosaccharide transport system permease protein